MSSERVPINLRRPPVTRPRGVAGKLVVGLVHLPRSVAALPDSLRTVHTLASAEETEQAQRFHAGYRRVEYLAGRILVRGLVSRHFDVSDPVVASSDCGRPYIADSQLSLSITHSSGWIAAAIMTDGPIGIDVEGRRKKTVLPRRLAARYQAEGLCSSLVFRYWHLIEAYAKSTGIPLGNLLHNADFCRRVDASRKQGWFPHDDMLLRTVRLTNADFGLCVPSSPSEAWAQRLTLSKITAMLA